MSREDRTIIIAGVAMLLMTLMAVCVQAQTIDFEQWNTRQIKESAIFGGDIKTLYDLPGHWATSNTHAKIMGIEKAAASVYPIVHGSGKACQMRVEQVSFSVMGIPVNAITTGSIYLGESNEPVDMRGANEPMTVLNMNYAYTNRPEALLFDYSAYVEQSTDISKANACKQVKHYQGRDGAEVTVLLQRRWEDKDGHVHALRVATATMRIWQSSNGWVEGFRLPLRYGDITHQTDYKPYEGLNAKGFMTKNQKGKMVLIEEDGFDGDAQPTHVILMFSAGCQPAFCGHVGNWFSVDNVCFR